MKPARGARGTLNKRGSTSRRILAKPHDNAGKGDARGAGARRVTSSARRGASAVQGARGGASAVTAVDDKDVGSTGGVKSGQTVGGGTYQQRYQMLKQRNEKERAEAIRNGVMHDPNIPRTLAEAITPIGTCPDMCPEFERVERITQNDVWGPEADRNAGPAENGWKLKPDESRMVKKFRRAAAGIDEQLPSELRPPATLQKTTNYLFDTVIAEATSLAQVHHFVWDRTRAIRNDFSIQQLTKVSDVEIAIDCYERIARFHILSLHQLALSDKPYEQYDDKQEREQLDKTLLSLIQYYDDNRKRYQAPNEAEFRAYYIIFQISGHAPDMENRVQHWPRSIVESVPVQVALDLYAAACNPFDDQGPLRPFDTQRIANTNWFAWWAILDETRVTYLIACVAEIQFSIIRRNALWTIWQAYKPTAKSKIEDWTLSDILEPLGFDDEDEVETFVNSLGISTAERQDGQAYVDLASRQNKELPPLTITLRKQIKSDFVESKREYRTLPAVISGLSPQQAREAGLVEPESAEDSQVDENMMSDDDDGSLFVQSKQRDTSNKSKAKFNVEGDLDPSAPAWQPSTSSLFTKSPFSTDIKPDPSQTTSNSAPNALFPSSATAFGQPAASESTTTNQAARKSTFGSGDAAPMSSLFTPGQNTTSSSETSVFNKPFTGFSFNSGFGSTAPTKVSEQQPSLKPSDFPFASPSSQSPQQTSASPNTGFSFTTQSQQPASQKPSSPFNGFSFPQPPAQPSQPEPPVVTSNPFAPQKPQQQRSTTPSVSHPPLPAFDGTSSAQASETSTPATPSDSKATTTSAPEPKSPAPPTLTTPKSSPSAFAKSKSHKPQSSSPLSRPPLEAEDAQDEPEDKQPSLFNSGSFKAPPFTGPQPPSIFPARTDSALKPQAAATTSGSTFTSFSSFQAQPKLQADAASASRDAEEAARRSKVAAEREARKEQTLDRLAKVTLLERGGLLEQYIEHTAGEMIVRIQREMLTSKLNAEADAHRLHSLEKKFFNKWRSIWWTRKLKKEGAARRERLKAAKEARLERDRRLSREVDVFSEMNTPHSNQAQHGDMSSAQKSAPPVATVQVSSTANAMTNHSTDSLTMPPPPRPDSRINPPQAYDALGLSALSPSHSHRRSQSAASQSFIAKSPYANRPMRSSSLRNSFVLSESPTNGDPVSSRVDSTKSLYFKLKARGLGRPDLNASVQRKRPRTSDSSDSPGAPPRKVNSAEVEDLQQSSVDAADEELFAAARKLREEMRQSESFYRKEVGRDSLNRSVSSRAGSPDNASVASSVSKYRAQLEDALRDDRDDRSRPSSRQSNTSFRASIGGAPPAYRNRVSKFVPREMYASNRAHQRQDFAASVGRFSPRSSSDGVGSASQSRIAERAQRYLAEEKDRMMRRSTGSADVEMGDAWLDPALQNESPNPAHASMTSLSASTVKQPALHFGDVTSRALDKPTNGNSPPSTLRDQTLDLETVKPPVAPSSTLVTNLNTKSSQLGPRYQASQSAPLTQPVSTVASDARPKPKSQFLSTSNPFAALEEEEDDDDDDDSEDDHDKGQYSDVDRESLVNGGRMEDGGGSDSGNNSNDDGTDVKTDVESEEEESEEEDDSGQSGYNQGMSAEEARDRFAGKAGNSIEDAIEL